jgi:hypothetical protein
MTGRLLRLIWLLAQAAVACWFLLSTAVDRQFLFFFVLALSFPAGLLPYFAAAAGSIALEEHFHLGVWGLLNALGWLAVVAVGYWQWFVFIPRHVLRRGSSGPRTLVL